MFNFKEYYHSNPEFRERHKAKSCMKVTCECGCIVSKSGLANHRKTPKHRNKIEPTELQKLKNELEELKIKMNSLNGENK